MERELLPQRAACIAHAFGRNAGQSSGTACSAPPNRPTWRKKREEFAPEPVAKKAPHDWSWASSDNAVNKGIAMPTTRRVAMLWMVVGGLLVAGIGSHAGERKELRFTRGSSSTTIEDAVVRGERNRYLIGAAKGQYLSLRITASEDNAVADVFLPGANDADETNVQGTPLPGAREVKSAVVQLPVSGTYLIVVGGTRGNAHYKLSVGITDQPPAPDTALTSAPSAAAPAADATEAGSSPAPSKPATATSDILAARPAEVPTTGVEGSRAGSVSPAVEPGKGVSSPAPTRTATPAQARIEVTLKQLAITGEKYEGKPVLLKNIAFLEVNNGWVELLPGVTLATNGSLSRINTTEMDKWVGFYVRSDDGEMFQLMYAPKGRFADMLIRLERGEKLDIEGEVVKLARNNWYGVVATDISPRPTSISDIFRGPTGFLVGASVALVLLVAVARRRRAKL